MIGDGAGFTSWIHLDDAAAATVLALDHEGPAIYNIVDDEPAATSEWLPVLAEALGAKPPRHVPAWVVRILAGEDAVMGATQSRGASNAKAKRELGWALRYPTWRVGFRAAHPTSTPAERSLSARRPGPARQVSARKAPGQPDDRWRAMVSEPGHPGKHAYDRGFLLGEKRNDLLALWEVQQYGRDSRADPGPHGG